MESRPRSPVRVGIAEYKIAKAPAVLVTYGIGSCVAISLWDGKELLGGLAHVMLPAEFKIRRGANPLKYADCAIEEMIKGMTAAGACRDRLVAKIAGGAHMFDDKSHSDRKDMADRNVQSVVKVLTAESIALRGRDTGGNYGRSVEFSPSDGVMRVRAIKHGIIFL